MHVRAGCFVSIRDGSRLRVRMGMPVVVLTPVLVIGAQVLMVVMVASMAMRGMRVSCRASVVRVTEPGRHERSHSHRSDYEASDDRRRCAAGVHFTSISSAMSIATNVPRGLPGRGGTGKS